jgi:hypothetical protein
MTPIKNQIKIRKIAYLVLLYAAFLFLNSIPSAFGARVSGEDGITPAPSPADQKSQKLSTTNTGTMAKPEKTSTIKTSPPKAQAVPAPIQPLPNGQRISKPDATSMGKKDQEIKSRK